jgi:hypothetical protein
MCETSWCIARRRIVLRIVLLFLAVTIFALFVVIGLEGGQDRSWWPFVALQAAGRCGYLAIWPLNGQEGGFFES